MLTEAELLDEEWATHWQATWRARMAAEEPSLRDVALHLASLQVGGCWGGSPTGRALGGWGLGGGWGERVLGGVLGTGDGAVWRGVREPAF